MEQNRVVWLWHHLIVYLFNICMYLSPPSDPGVAPTPGPTIPTLPPLGCGPGFFRSAPSLPCEGKPSLYIYMYIPCILVY